MNGGHSAPTWRRRLEKHGRRARSTGSAPARTFALTYTPGEGFGGTWAPDGRAFEDLVYRDGADPTSWRFPLDGSPPRAVTAFASDLILNYRWSTDGKTLVMSRGTRSSDLVLITNDDR